MRTRNSVAPPGVLTPRCPSPRGAAGDMRVHGPLDGEPALTEGLSGATGRRWAWTRLSHHGLGELDLFLSGQASGLAPRCSPSTPPRRRQLVTCGSPEPGTLAGVPGPVG